MGLPGTASKACENIGYANFSIIIRAAQVIPALRADQLAVMPSEAMRTVGAGLRVVLWPRRGRRLIMRDVKAKIRIERARPLRQHG